ncbi:MAG: carbohydrate ABC transporter permease [Chloroflexi bacterium]|nr:carbohydrate ABC transporter permease [Chloroflexota bacterium]
MSHLSIAHRAPLLSPRAARRLRRGLLYLLLSLGSIAMCFPFLWMLLTSFKTYAEAIATPPTVFPGDWGERLLALGMMIRLYPWVIALFALWIWLGRRLSRRIPDRVIGGLCFFLYMVLFFAVFNLDIWGQFGLGRLYAVAQQRLGLELTPLFQNYVDAWARAPFGAYFRNSIIISTLTPLLIVLTSAPAAYAFARLEFPAKNLIFMLYLATMMVPSEVIVIPNFITISELGWRNTYLALIVPYMVSVISIFFLRQFFRSLPDDLYDAAVIDGSGHVRFLASIAMPLARPALVSTALFNFLGSWNALLWPLLVTDKEEMRPIALGLAAFSTEAGMQAQLYMAAASFTIVPVLILFLFVQEQFIAGIARTGIK